MFSFTANTIFGAFTVLALVIQTFALPTSPPGHGNAILSLSARSNTSNGTDPSNEFCRSCLIADIGYLIGDFEDIANGTAVNTTSEALANTLNQILEQIQTISPELALSATGKRSQENEDEIADGTSKPVKRSNPSVESMTAAIKQILDKIHSSMTPEEEAIWAQVKSHANAIPTKRDDDVGGGCAFCIFEDIAHVIGGLFESAE